MKGLIKYIASLAAIAYGLARRAEERGKGRKT